MTAAPNAAAAPGPSRPGRAWRRVGLVVVALLLLLLLVWALVPGIAKRQGEARLSELLGRRVTIGDLSWRPWSLEVTLRDLAIAAADPSAPPQFTLAGLHADAKWSSLWHRAPVVEALVVERPQLRIARTAQGRYDIDDVLAKLAASASPAAAPASSEPARFALYNLELHEGSAEFEDRPAGHTHHLEDLKLALPFLSNLPEDVETHVLPRLAFRLNDASVDTGAQVRPFRADRAGQLELRWQDLDFADYAGYLPASLPLRLKQGRSSGELSAEFLWTDGRPGIAIRGQLGLDGVAVTSPDGQALVAWDRLQVPLEEVRPFLRRVRLGAIEWSGLRSVLRREADGRLELQRLVDRAGSAGASAAPASGAGATGEASAPAAAPAASPDDGWQFAWTGFALHDLQLRCEDHALSPARAWTVASLNLKLGALSWPAPAPVPLSGDVALPWAGAGVPIGEPGATDLAAAAGGPTETAQLHFEGEANDRRARLEWRAEAWALSLLRPYLAAWLDAQLDGTAGLEGRLDWSAAGPDASVAQTAAAAPDVAASAAPATDTSARLRLALSRVTLSDLALTPRDSRTPAAAWKRLQLDGLDIDLLEHRVTLGQLALEQPMARIARDARGGLSAAAWMKPAASPSVSPAAVGDGAEPSTPAGAPWRVAVEALRIDGAKGRWTDAATATRIPVDLDLSQLNLQANGLQWSQDPSAVLPPARVQLDLRLGQATGRPDVPGSLSSSAPGQLSWRGQVGASPVRATGRLRVDRWPVHAVEPYFGQQLPVRLLRLRAGYDGDVTVGVSAKGLSAKLAGDATLADLAVYARPAAGSPANVPVAPEDQLLSWQRLLLPRLRVETAPGARPRVELGRAELTDFYARLVVTEQGRLNLEDVGRGEPAPPAEVASAPTAAPEAASAAPAAASVASAAAGEVAASAPSAALSPSGAASSPLSASTLPLDLAFDGLGLVNGRIDFSDHFIRPNYSAALTELNGSIGRFRSGTPEMAALELRGRAAGTALLEIVGQLNPTANPLSFDIQAKATDLELAPLSAYAGKYAGYAIKRGKLSMDVHYKIQPDGRLEAGNQVVLNQLTFGDKIDSPQATKLPVLLAVALLKDRNGVIDINLPISGSINDPQFSIGGLIWKVLGNLLVKAVTAPFSLLSGGGGPDLSEVAFEPGRTTPTPAGLSALEKVAKALDDRPSLKMTVTGWADAAAEADAYRDALLEQRLVQERRRELQRDGAPADAPVVLERADRDRLLAEVYRQTRLPDKPRNLIGLVRDLPPDEMAVRLKAALPADETALRDLALQRGLAVRDRLAAHGLAGERLFLAAPKLIAPGQAPSRGPSAELAVDGR